MDKYQICSIRRHWQTVIWGQEYFFLKWNNHFDFGEISNLQQDEMLASRNLGEEIIFWNQTNTLVQSTVQLCNCTTVLYFDVKWRNTEFAAGRGAGWAQSGSRNNPIFQGVATRNRTCQFRLLVFLIFAIARVPTRPNSFTNLKIYSEVLHNTLDTYTLFLLLRGHFWEDFFSSRSSGFVRQTNL